MQTLVQTPSTGGVPIFVFCTTGTREDGWTIYVNVLIDSGLCVRVDHRSFLHIVPAMDRQLKQSAGRIARVHDGIVCVLTAGDPDSSREELTFGDQLQAYLGATSLGIPWPLETMRWTTLWVMACLETPSAYPLLRPMSGRFGKHCNGISI